MACRISSSVTSAISSTHSRATCSGCAPTNGGVSPSAIVWGRGAGTGLPAASAGVMPGPRRVPRRRRGSPGAAP
jgi:hypothetical protein